ncbi:MAG: hypothetical protein QNJ90_05270 [Planctomycetota bacterium]|nr:hypothetical protein [Planctomycetota bacterium]
MDAPQGEYRRKVLDELRVRCIHLTTKEQFVGLPEDHEQEFPADEPIWWCAQTSEPLGPDGSEACRENCQKPGRTCYEGPVRL